MKSPVTGKEMELIRERKTMQFRKESFEIVYHYFRCLDSGEEFESEELIDLNLRQVYNEYRAKHNLPFPEEIKAIREKYGLSGARMADVLGFGTNIYRNYENGEIPSISNARLIQLVKDPREFKKLVELNDQIDDQEKEKIFLRIAKLPLKEESERLFLERYLLKDLSSNQFSGYKRPNLEKFCHMAAFFAEKLHPWKVKMNKLLFYADFGHFKRFGESISGIKYIAIRMGPVPNNYDGLLNWAREQECIHVDCEYFNNGVGEQYFPGKIPIDPALFSEKELSTMTEVVEKFRSTSTQEIIEISHGEKGWQDCLQGHQFISYQYAFELQNF
jgi:putative zinc finger/helix-turn-helix YgiT family protein